MQTVTTLRDDVGAAGRGTVLVGILALLFASVNFVVLVRFLGAFGEPLVDPIVMPAWAVIAAVPSLVLPRGTRIVAAWTSGDLLTAFEWSVILTFVTPCVYGLYLRPFFLIPISLASALTLMSAFRPRFRFFRAGPVSVSAYPLWAAIAVACTLAIYDARYSEVPVDCGRAEFGPGIRRLHVPWEFRARDGGEVANPRYYYLTADAPDSLVAVSANSESAGLLFVSLNPPHQARFANLGRCRAGMPFLLAGGVRWLALCTSHPQAAMISFDPATENIHVEGALDAVLEGDIRDTVLDERGDAWVLAETDATLFHVDGRTLAVVAHEVPALAGRTGVSLTMAYDAKRERLLVTQPFKGVLVSIPTGNPARAEILYRTAPVIFGVAVDQVADRILVGECLSVVHCRVRALDAESLRPTGEVSVDTAPRALAVSARRGILLVVNGGAAGSIAAVRLGDLEKLRTFEIGGMTHSVAFHPTKAVAYAGSRCGIFELDLPGSSGGT